jgi:hypothetical protein
MAKKAQKRSARFLKPRKLGRVIRLTKRDVVAIQRLLIHLKDQKDAGTLPVGVAGTARGAPTLFDELLATCCESRRLVRGKVLVLDVDVDSQE